MIKIWTLLAQQPDPIGIPVGVWIFLGVVLVAIVLGLLVGARSRADDSPTVRDTNIGVEPIEKDAPQSQLGGGVEAPIPQTGGDDIAGTATQASVDRTEGLANYEDLTLLEGIGPGAQQMLNGAGIYTFQQLAETTAGELRTIIQRSGIRASDPQTWPEQARLAAEGRWSELQDMQKRIRE